MESAEQKLRSAVLLLLDQVDYTAGACRVNEMVGAVLSTTVIRRVRDILEETRHGTDPISPTTTIPPPS